VKSATSTKYFCIASNISIISGLLLAKEKKSTGLKEQDEKSFRVKARNSVVERKSRIEKGEREREREREREMIFLQTPRGLPATGEQLRPEAEVNL